MTTFALLGDYSKVAETVENELNPPPCPQTAPTAAPDGENGYLKGLCREVLKKNNALREENGLLKEELNELYLKYDQMSAAFGEISHFVRQAAAVSPSHSL